MASVNQWRIYCNTESTWVYNYLDISNTTGPTTCPNDTAHTVNIDSVSIVNTISENTVTIKEQATPTGNNYMVEGYSFVANANTVTTKTINWPIPINLLGSNYNTTSSQSGDIVNFISDNITIGYITSNVSIDDTVINCSSTAINAVFLGYELIITDNTNTNELNIVTNINKNTSTLTINQAATNSFTTGALIKMRRRFVKNIVIGISQLYKPGEDKIGSSYVPANTNLNLVYTNNSNTNNTVIFEMHYIY